MAGNLFKEVFEILRKGTLGSFLPYYTGESVHGWISRDGSNKNNR